MKPWLALALMSVALSGSPARAEQWALLIGVNQYDDARIAPLRTAAADVKLLEKALVEGLKVPADHIETLTSDGSRRPTRSNIAVSLQRLAQNAKPGDGVFVLYSGHGVELSGKPYLIPADAGALNGLPVAETLLPTSQFEELLGQVKARSVVIAWDMCRNDPLARGKSAVSEKNVMTPGQSKGWRKTSAGGGDGKRVTVHLYACSPGQCSYEWQEQGQGYFSYYLDKALRGGAADEKGEVTVSRLVRFLEAAVPAKVKVNENAEQSPSARIEGFGAESFVLSQGFPSVSALPAAPVARGARAQKIDTRAQLAFRRPIPETRLVIDRKSFVGDVYEADLGPDPTKVVEVYAEAPGYRGTLWKVPLVRGKRTELSLALDPLPPAPETLGPPRTGEEAIQRLLSRHQAEKLLKARRLTFLSETLRVRLTPDGKGTVEKAEAGQSGEALIEGMGLLLKTLQRLARGEMKVVSRSGRSLRAIWKTDLSVWEIEYDTTGFVRALKKYEDRVTQEWDFNRYTRFGELDLPATIYYKNYAATPTTGATYAGRWEVTR